MKLAALFAAAGIAVAVGAVTPAHADRIVQTTRTVTTTRSTSGPHWSGHRHRACRTIWRHHHRIQRCVYR